jgi:hypothetical protein
MKSRLFVCISGVALAAAAALPARGDGVCDPDGWCRLHRRLARNPYSTVSVRVEEAFGPMRIVWLKAGPLMDTLRLDCASGWLGVASGGAVFNPRFDHGLRAEVYESACLNWNVDTGFPP